MTYDKKPVHDPMIGKTRCMISKCMKRTEYILYFLVGPNVDIKSMRGAMCKDHAQSELEYYSQQLNRECHIELIDDINKRTGERINKTNGNNTPKS